MRRALSVLPLLALALLGVTGGAVAGGDRQDAQVRFTEKGSGQPAGLREGIDYLPSGGPGTKPYAVEKVVLSLARGSRIRTSVPGRCRASNAELMAEGASACPRRSRVGRGRLTLDTGQPGPGRHVRNRVKLLNNRRELILLTRTTNTPSTQRFVSRSEVRRRKFITRVPPIPGGPPDGFTAIDLVRLRLEEVTDRVHGVRRGYIETPEHCRDRGSWTNRLRFTYRDGATRVEKNASPCVR